MKRTYYLFNPGRMSRKDNTLKFTPIDNLGNASKPKYLPIEGLGNLYIFGSVDANSAIYNFLGKKQISCHFFDYYEHYTGSFMPKEYLLAGKLQVEQTKAYLQSAKRMHLAQQFVKGGSDNMLKIIRYYHNRKAEMGHLLADIEKYQQVIPHCANVKELMGIEGNCRSTYYEAFELIITDFKMNGRHKQPPSNEVNALISFGNMLCYTQCLDQIYHTQLNPTISFLHEPGVRRYSLALDLAEIFKPILVDRTIFRVLNRKEIKADDFEKTGNGCFLKEKGKKTFLRIFEERLKDTIQHPTLKRKVSYKHLIRLECYKLTRYMLKIDKIYQPYKMKG